MWLGRQTECFQNVKVGGKGVYNVSTFQKSRGARAHIGRAKHMYVDMSVALPKCSPDIYHNYVNLVVVVCGLWKSISEI